MMVFRPELASPAGFARFASGGVWKPAAHLLFLNRILLAAAAGEDWASRVIIQMPPRHGKSEFVSGYFPAWYLGLHPHRKVILTSFSDDLAQGWGQRNRDVLQDVGSSLFNVRVRQDSSAKGRWLMSRHRGSMVATGMGGTLTGRGGNLIIVDDPVKNDVEALSPTYRQRNKSWYRATLRTRLEQPGAIIVIQTRWHQDDLAGWLQKESDEDWLVVSLPAIAEADEEIYLPDDPTTPAWTRKKGEALWPEKIPLADLLGTMASMGGENGHWWRALYQQSPTKIGGGVLKPEEFRRYERVDGGYVLDTPAGPRMVPMTATRFGIMDLAASLKTQADYTVLGVFAMSGPDLLLLDILRGRWEGPDLPRVASQVYAVYKPGYIGVEQVGFQLSTVQDLRRGDPRADPPRPPLPIKGLQPHGDKMTRALTLAARLGGGNVYAPTSAPWLAQAEAEMAEFPRGEHDDVVDVLSYAALEQSGWHDSTLRGT